VETEGEQLQEEVQKFPATALPFYETAPSYLKKWTKKLSAPGILQLGNLEQNTFMADIETTLSHVIKTVQSVQSAENEMYDELCLCSSL
jgi:hypothetical protein